MFDWIAIPLCLLLCLFFPNASWVELVPLTLGLGIGNASAAWLLGCPPCACRLREARWLGTGVEWLLAFALLYFSAGTLVHAMLPALLLMLVLATGLRYGLRGLLTAGLGAALLIGFVVAWHSLTLGVLVLRDAVVVLVGWELLIALTTLLTAGTLRARGDWYRWEQQQQAYWGATARRIECKLSLRELELLPWLAQEDLTYEQIAAELHISPSTVRVHTRHIGEKLGVSGRRRVVLAARQRRLLPMDQGLRLRPWPQAVIQADALAAVSCGKAALMASSSSTQVRAPVWRRNVCGWLKGSSTGLRSGK